MLLLGCAALRPARPGRPAATVLVLGLLLLGAAAAEAQTTRTLVSNTAQTGDDSANTSGNKHAQLFHTGGNTLGYTLTSVVVNSDDVEDDPFDVGICTADTTANEFPTTTCTALTAPNSFVGVGNVVFTHTGLALLANTNYVVMISQRGTGSVELDSTTSSGEDSNGLSDWSIKNKFYWQQGGTTWMEKSGSNEALSIIVFGYANTVVTTDATLSALSVSGATLSPAFDAATLQYGAKVANSVTQVTVTHMTSEPTATVAHTDATNNALTDADGMTPGFQLNLVPGDNEIKLRVTAPDGITDKDYQIAIVRHAAVASCSAAAMVNPIWTGNLTAGQIGTTLFGFLSFSGDLDDTTFSYGGTNYTISSVTSGTFFGDTGFDFALDGNFGAAAADLVLHVGNTQYQLDDATLTGNTYKWTSNLPSWANGTGVCLALTVNGPEVSSVALTSAPGSDNTYAIGDSVAATVTFDAAVDIAGTPQLELDFDGNAKAAGCATGTNTTTMACSYTVGVGDSAPNGVAIAANKLTGGTITATGSTTINADLDHTAVAIDADHKVDGIRPTLVTSGSDAPTTSTDGETVLLVFSEAIGFVTRSLITIQANSVNLSTTMASVAGTKVELTLTTALTDTTATLTVALSADAVEDNAENGNLAVAATAVTNAYVLTPPGQPAAPSVSSVANSTTSLSVTWTAPTNTGPAIDDYNLRYREGTSGPWIPSPQGMSVSGTSATITGLTASTLYQVQVQATNSDGNGPWSPSGSGQTNTAGNSAPTFPSSTASRSVAENSAAGTDVGAPVTATDIDNDQLTYTLEEASFTIVSTSGQIRTRSGVTYDYETTPSYTVIVKVDDGNGGTGTVTVTIDLTNDVNERPLAPAAPRVTATPNTTDSLTVRWSAPSNTGRPAISSYDLQYREGTSGDWIGPQNETGTSATITGLTAAPTAYRVQVRATNSDGTGPWSPSGRIRTPPPPPVNSPPRAVDDAAKTPEDTPVTISVLGNDSDPNGNTLTLVEVSAPTHGTAVAADTGEVVYTPEPDFHGTDSFTYVVGDGSRLTARAAVTVTVLPVNDPPLAVDDAADTPEDTPVTISVLGNDSDVEGDALALVEASAPTHGTVRLTDTGAVVYTPEPDFHGTDSFTYVVGDGSGLTARAAVTVTVLPVNDPPLAVDDAEETPEDTPVTISVLGNDSDPDGDALTVVEASAPTHGTAVADTGEVVYTPEPDFHGTDRFTYLVGDGSGLTARAAVTVTVRPVNDPPLAGDDAADTPEDTPVTISVLGNDSDVEGDALTVVEASAPTHGTAVADTGAVVYTPEPDFHGTDRFTYLVGDGSGLTARAAVTVTVRPVNDPPLATGVIPDRTLDVGDGPVALDLIPFFADRDGDALDYTAVVSDQAVAVSLTGATLTLTATRPGTTATVTVTAQDPDGLTATQAFMVTTTDHQARSVKAWLARFGRTVANHAVEAVRGRMSSAQGPSRRVTLGGAELKEPPATEITQASPWDELIPEDQRPENFNSLRVREFLLSSSFEVPLAQNPGPGWTAWGGAARTSFSGRDSDLSIDGDVTTATLGVDRAWDRVLLGLALGRSTGDGSYDSGDIRGDLKSSITSAHPYLRFSLNDRLSAWTLLGYGKGELTLTHEGGGEKTDIEMKMAALGARGAMVAAGGFDISARTDALLVRTSSEGTSRMTETEADVSRLRLVLEGSRSLTFASGTSLTPSVEVGVRRDGGDAERGVGFEMGGAMRYVNPSIGLTVEITARRLMAHEQSGYSEWGAGGSLQFAPGGAERGFSAKLGSSVGTAASGVEGLWAMGDARGLTGGAQVPGRVDAEAGYAMGAFGGSGVITPYGGFSMSGDRRYRAGWRLRLGDSFNLSFEGDRTGNPDLPSSHGVALRGDLRW